MCNSRRLCENEKCQTCFENSFASHDKSKYWSDKNCNLKPRQVFKKTTKKYWFDCVCEHSFENTLCNITNHNQWCPYCTNKKLCEREDCQGCFEKSFASHEKSKYWSGDNELKPI